MAQGPRIVAELGRPETAEETAERKAASSFAYRSSKTVRNLVAALLVTLVIVAVIVFAVPRGQAPEAPPVDVAAIAAQTSATYQRPVLAPSTPDDWLVNSAAMGPESAWTVVYAPGDSGFVRLSQGFDADAAWATRLLGGAGPVGTVTIDGVVWEQYSVGDSARAGNVATALATTAGADRILVAGSATIAPEQLQRFAAQLTPQIDSLRKEGA